MKKFFSILIFPIYLAACSQNQNNEVLIESKIVEKINSSFLEQKVQNETIEFETNKYGKIISVSSNQEQIKSILTNEFIIPTLIDNKLISIKGKLSIENSKIKNYSEFNPRKDSLIGKIATAIKLNNYMSLKKYNNAIHLFSKDINSNLKKVIKDKESLEYWSSAWSLKGEMLDDYINMIISYKNDNGFMIFFVLEENEWKINEN